MKAVLFDLDGTLWDSSGQVVPAWNEAMEMMGLEKRITAPEIQSYMGRTLEDIGRGMFPQLTAAQSNAIMKSCCENEERYLANNGGILYPELEETLEYLQKKYFLGIVSNCQDGYIQVFLKYHKLERLFDDFECSGRTGKHKGENIRILMQRNGITNAVFVGDTQKDLDAADYAGISFIHASYGFGSTNRRTDVIERFSALHDIL